MNTTFLKTCKPTLTETLNSTEIAEFVKGFNLSVKFLNSHSEQKPIFDSVEKNDVLFIYLSYSLINNTEVKEILTKNTSKQQLIIGLSEEFESSVLKDLVEFGVKNFLFEPISINTLNQELSPLLEGLIEKREDCLSQLKMALSHGAIGRNHYQLNGETYRKIFVYSSSQGILNSDLIFGDRINDDVLMVIGTGKDNEVQTALQSTNIYDWLTEQVEKKEDSRAVVDQLIKTKEMDFEIVTLSFKSKEVNYFGQNNLVIFRDGFPIEVPNGERKKLEAKDSVFLFNKGCFQQLGCFDRILGKENFIGLLKLIEPHDNKQRRHRLNYFFESFRSSNSQSENIALLGFTV